MKHFFFSNISGTMMPQQTYQPQGFQREVSQTFDTAEHKTSTTYQKFQQQQKTEKYGYSNGVYTNGHSAIEVNFFFCAFLRFHTS